MLLSNLNLSPADPKPEFVFEVEPKESRVIKTYYLSDKYVKFVSSIAERNKLSESKALEFLLKSLIEKNN